MNAETINLVAIIVLGTVAVAALIVLAYGQRKGDATLTAALQPTQALAESLLLRFDTVLVPYGDKLRPINDLTTAAGTLIDEPTDFAVQLLPQDVTAIANLVIQHIQTLTDGKPQEAVPLGENPPEA